MATSRHWQSPGPIASVVVIGAGPSGLAAARRLKDSGLRVTVLERRRQAGGIWFFEHATPLVSKIPSGKSEAAMCPNSVDGVHTSEYGDCNVAEAWKVHAPPSACYDALTTNIVTPLMKFQGFEYPQNTKWFVPHETVLKYLLDFSKTTGIDDLIKYNTKALSVSKILEGAWRLEIDTMHLDHEHRRLSFDRSEEGRRDYSPALSDFCSDLCAGLKQWSFKWPDNVIHSREYRNNSRFKNKNVLVIGSGVSAFDLGKDMAFVAHVVYQTVRPRLCDDRPASEKLIEQLVWSTTPDNVLRRPEAVQFCDVQRAQHMHEAEVLLSDGTYLSGIDYVVLCTGYLYSLPFLKDQRLNGPFDGAAAPDSSIIISDGSQLHNLHLDMFYIPDPTIAFIGVPHDVATFPLFDLQASAIAAVFSGQSLLPDEQSMHSSYQRRKSVSGPGKAFHSYGIQKELAYIREIVYWVNSPAIRAVARDYEKDLLEAQDDALQIFKERLLATTSFRGKSKEEIRKMIEVNTKVLEAELERLKCTVTTAKG